MNGEVYVNGIKVRMTGSIVALNDEPVRFALSEGFVIVFRFVHDDNQEGRHRRADIVEKELVFTFVNYEDQLGAANSEKIELGTIGGVKILMNFALFYIGEVARHTRVIHYTFLEVPQVKGGVA